MFGCCCNNSKIQLSLWFINSLLSATTNVLIKVLTSSFSCILLLSKKKNIEHHFASYCNAALFSFLKNIYCNAALFSFLKNIAQALITSKQVQVVECNMNCNFYELKFCFSFNSSKPSSYKFFCYVSYILFFRKLVTIYSN